MSLADVAAVIVLAVFLFALCVPVGEASGRSSGQMQNATQLRGMHQGIVTYANSNRNYYPGLDRAGAPVALDVEQRFELLLEGDYFTPEYTISPFETDPAIREWPGSGAVTSDHYSFAMLQVPTTGGRYDEWKATLNSQAVVLTDRNIGTELDTYGIHNDKSESSSLMGCSYNHRQPYQRIGHWVGWILLNDNYVDFIETDSPDTVYAGTATTGDKLFSSPGDDDALLIHSGN